MSLRCRTNVSLTVMVLLAGCGASHHEPAGPTSPNVADGAVVTSGLAPGLDHSLSTVDPRAAPYYDNAKAVIDGKRLFGQFNCSGCHSNGGGGMGPSLMDDEWIYGDRLEQIHQSLVEGRPNGMPAWGGKIADEQLWELAAYVRSMSLPQTLAAQNGATPSQSPAPVPRAAGEDPGWSPPPDTTNDYTSTTEGP
ncbi:MAG TPA: cytochrome c [Steroidobacteraceae bacterium]